MVLPRQLFKKTSNLALDNLFRKSVLSRVILEKICSIFAFVKSTINIISNIWRMFLHSSFMVSLVNTLDHVSRYLTHLLFFTNGNIWVFKAIHSGMMLSTSQLFLDNNSWKWDDISFTASSPKLLLSLSIDHDFVSSKTSIFLKMEDY